MKEGKMEMESEGKAESDGGSEERMSIDEEKENEE